jgi:hypothetical protein
MKHRIKQALLFLLKPKAMILGFAIFNLYWMSWRESHIDWQFLNYHGYYENTHRAILLLLASLGLLLNRWWSLLIAGSLGGWIVYVLVFRALAGVSNAHDVPMFSQFALRNWWLSMDTWQPQYIIQIALALVVLCYSLVCLMRLTSQRLAANEI